MADKVELGFSGFALDEYLVPPCQVAPKVKGGTMTKATAGAGGLFAETAKHAEKAPGPGHYHKELLERSFVKEATGGIFSKLTRDWGKNSEKTPAVGQYDVTNHQTTKRIRGGLMSKTDRKCAFAKLAEKASLWNSNGPGKYDAHLVTKHKRCPSFSAPSTESRNGKKISTIGPGHYNPNYEMIEHHVPCYSSSKEDSGTFLNRLHKDKDKIPFPCYKDMPESKVHDKLGKRNHCDSLIKDRDVPPRIYPPAVTSRRRETTPRAATAPHSARGTGTPRAMGGPRSARGTSKSARATPVQASSPTAMMEVQPVQAIEAWT